MTAVFVCGFASGGTDLTKNVLNAHPGVHLFSELPHLASIRQRGYGPATKFTSMAEIVAFRDVLRDLHRGDNFENIDERLAQDLLEEQLARKGALGLGDALKGCLSTHQADVWGAKISVAQIEAIATLLPEAVFVIVSRDVRDVCLSWRNKWGKDVVWCADKWATRMAAGLRAARRLAGDRYRLVKFEELLAETESTCRELCRFLKIPFSARMLSYHEHTSRWDGKINYGQPISPGNRTKWRGGLNARTLRRIEEVAFTTMGILKYEPEVGTKHRPIRRFEKARGLCVDSLAILFVGNRALRKNTLPRRVATALQVLRGSLLRWQGLTGGRS